VRNKQKACEYTGIASVKIAMPAETTQEELLSKVRELNEDPSINGILVQLPLPKGLDANEVIRAISPLKDVDGFHPQSVGALSIGLPGFKSCTPAGIIELIKRSGIETEGRECVIVGRSNIVGKPMAMMMIRENATVTVAHSRTVDLPAVCRRADILITAVGRAKMFNREYVKPGAAVIDCGMNRDENGKLCGDVDYEDVFPVASAITPVPGGVGPMTVAMLMKNCLDSARIQGIV
jgi:methylenetetrahydrofolate dehydrogenase (NADP+)/methenyltetrahydrofolate cyclohydrolase